MYLLEMLIPPRASPRPPPPWDALTFPRMMCTHVFVCVCAGAAVVPVPQPSGVDVVLLHTLWDSASPLSLTLGVAAVNALRASAPWATGTLWLVVSSASPGLEEVVRRAAMGLVRLFVTPCASGPADCWVSLPLPCLHPGSGLACTLALALAAVVAAVVAAAVHACYAHSRTF